MNIDKLMVDNKPLIFSKLLQMTQNKQVSEDLYQELYIHLRRKIDSGAYNDQGNPMAWIMRVLSNLIIDYHRKNRKHKIRTVHVIDDDDIPWFTVRDSALNIEEQTIVNEDICRVQKALKQISPELQQIIDLRIYKGQSYKQIQQETNVTMNTLLSRFRYAKQRVKNILKAN